MNRLTKEYRVFLAQPRATRILLLTNAVYALVLPVIEIFMAAYVMRNSHDVSKVVTLQLAVYAGDPVAFFVNGILLGRVAVKRLYAAGMVLSSIALLIMMSSNVITAADIAVSGILMGTASGLFWANRGYLALSTTNDLNRNYFYGFETFFSTVSAVVVPAAIGWFIAAGANHAWARSNRNDSYRIVAVCSVVLTVISSVIIHFGTYENPPKTRFLYLRFNRLWNKMLGLASLKGLAQGYLVTAPAMLILLLVGQEGTLGVIQAIGGIASSIMVYTVGRVTKPKHRVWVFASGLLLFALGSMVNAALFNATGVLIFMACLILGRPAMDVAYFPIQLLLTDTVAAMEGRNHYAYIFSHEIGLFAGRLVGCGLFILLAIYVSHTFALKYALPLIAIVQLASIWVAKDLLLSVSKVHRKPAIAIADMSEMLHEQ
jgi:YQGE family putative transporter